MTFQRVGSLLDIPEGSVREMMAGDCPLAVCRVNGEVYAVEGMCPHRGGPLGHGALHGTTLVCPLHGWEFDCTTGHATFSDSLSVLKFPVRVECDDVLVDVG